MSLAVYREKRHFGKTSEPQGGKPQGRKGTPKTGFSYVIQKHAARRLHYDFRLELDGVLLSWAVPKGPSLDPTVKRLAVQTEDHPIEYGSFEGEIPQGEYGAGTVEIWDRGTWEPQGEPREQYQKGRLTFLLHGERLKGRWHLVKTARSEGRKANWMLIKGRDQQASTQPPSPNGARAATAVTSAVDQNLLKRAPRGGLPKEPAVELATLVDEVPEGDDWLHELKYDGYRLLARIDNHSVALSSRNGKDFTHLAPRVAEQLAKLPIRAALLDGELVLLRDDGVSDFQLLQNAINLGQQAALVYYAFDLLHLDGHDTRPLPLEQRKALLRRLLQSQADPSPIRYSDHLEGSGKELFQKACRSGLEGILSKRRSAPYRAARTQDWLKIKCSARQEFVIGGYTDPAGSREHLGALLIGLREGKRVKYAGKVGTGFTRASLAELEQKLEPLQRESPPFTDPPRGSEARGAHWVEPLCVAEIEFTEFTADGRLRHPRFRGLREDKPAAAATREHAAPTPRPSERATSASRPKKTGNRVLLSPGAAPKVAKKHSATQPARVRALLSKLSHPEKVMYPEQGITKLELADYYAKVAEHMLPLVVDRPLTLVRCPRGQGHSCFFQKHAQPGQDPAIRVIPLADKDGPAEYTAIDDLEGLLALPQMGVLEIHTWGSRTGDPEHPDMVVLDLDPDPDVAWSRVVRAANLVRELLERLDLRCFAKTTGGKGLHVCVPLVPSLGWDQVKDFTRAIAVAMQRHAPNEYVSTMSKAKRKNKIFIDFFRNGRGATFIAPYSTRARPGAPVSTPLAWDELDEHQPPGFTIRTLPGFLDARKRDPWRNFAQAAEPLTKARLRALNG